MAVHRFVGKNKQINEAGQVNMDMWGEKRYLW